jgi:DNA-binding NarL/FixJ family response regulator
MMTIAQSLARPSPRDLEVLQLLAEGRCYKEIAEALNCNPHNIARRMENIRNKYAPTNESVVALAVTLEWISVRVNIIQETP